MPSYQKLALNCNSRWRYKGSKFDSIPYKPLKICSGSFSLEPAQKLERFICGAVSNFHPVYLGWKLQLRSNFWQGPFSEDALLENGTKFHNFTNLFFVTSHFGTLYENVSWGQIWSSPWKRMLGLQTASSHRSLNRRAWKIQTKYYDDYFRMNAWN